MILWNLLSSWVLWHWMSRIEFSELQNHIVCWIGTFIQTILLLPSSREKILTTSFLVTFVPLYKTTVWYIQEDHNLNVCHRSHLGNLLIGWVAVGYALEMEFMQLGVYLFQFEGYHDCKNVLHAAICVRWRLKSGWHRNQLMLPSFPKTCFLSL